MTQGCLWIEGKYCNNFSLEALEYTIFFLLLVMDIYENWYTNMWYRPEGFLFKENDGKQTAMQILALERCVVFLTG